MWGAASLSAQQTSLLRRVLESDLQGVERNLTSLAEAMPADKYDFAPTAGEFTGARTFGLQLRHVATTNYVVAAFVLGEKKIPVETGTLDNGSDSLRTKEQIVQYLKDSFAYTRKAFAAITDQNATELLDQKAPWTAFGQDRVPRILFANLAVWHTYDHYGQLAVYLRMNGVVPPASRKK